MVGMSTPDSTANNKIASAFVEQHQSEVIGVLHGWDRLRLQGTLRSMYYQPVMEEYLWQSKVLWKDFKRFATDLTGRVRGAAEKLSVGQSAIEPHTQRGSRAPDSTTRQSQTGSDRGFELCGAVPHLVFAGESTDAKART
jgi:hypothetical protein